MAPPSPSLLSTYTSIRQNPNTSYLTPTRDITAVQTREIQSNKKKSAHSIHKHQPQATNAARPAQKQAVHTLGEGSETIDGSSGGGGPGSPSSATIPSSGFSSTGDEASLSPPSELAPLLSPASPPSAAPASAPAGARASSPASALVDKTRDASCFPRL